MSRRKSRFIQGKFKPLNPQKYIGDPTDIVYRSSWEKKFFQKMDETPSVKGWCSEEIVIGYISPVDNKAHRYFVDVLVVSTTNVVTLIEIKPYAQTQPPNGKGNKERQIREAMTYMVNTAKWKAASEYCKKRGWSFKIVTEKDINFK